MNVMSASPADAAPAAAGAESLRPVKIWDAPVRVFHWLMVLCFAGAWITSDSEHWRLLHVTFGYTMAGLVGFRLLWGLLGTRHARFTDFVRGPRAVAAYVGSLLRGRPEHHVGHNPAGALAIVALLVLTLIVTAAGWATYNEVGGEWLEELHEGAANTMLAVVLVHVAGVLLGSWMHRENLVRSMVDGRKLGTPGDAIRRAWSGLAALMLAAVLGFWWLQWQDAPAGGGATTPALVQHRAAAGHGADQDDD